MLALSSDLKRSLSDTYLSGVSHYANRVLRSRTGRRDFSRVRIVAALGRRNGIARGAYLQWQALRHLGVEAELLDATSALRNPLFRLPHQAGSAYIFHSAGPQAASLIACVLPQAADAYRVAYWAWELPDPPVSWAGCDRIVSEIWTPSAFAQSSLAQLVQKPIHVVQHHIPAPEERPSRVKRPFTVLSMADSRSSLSRKNPEGAVRAFRAAFGTSHSARLVLKLSGRDEELQQFEEDLREPLRAGNIELLKDDLDEASLSELFRNSDVYLSLHRAEGFGLPLLEAMAHGVPVVGTGWSGNCEFMNSSNSLLVPFTLVPVRDRSAVYSTSVWAEPDLKSAAGHLRLLFENPEQRDQLAAAAHAFARSTKPRFPFEITTT